VSLLIVNVSDDDDYDYTGTITCYVADNYYVL